MSPPSRYGGQLGVLARHLDAVDHDVAFHCFLVEHLDDRADQRELRGEGEVEAIAGIPQDVGRVQQMERTNAAGLGTLVLAGSTRGRTPQGVQPMGLCGRAAHPTYQVGGVYFDEEEAMTPKNIALEPELLEQVGKRAQEEGKTADELANELLAPLLEIRRRAESSDRRWQQLLDYGRGQAEKLGITERDVDRLIHEWRSEQRGR